MRKLQKTLLPLLLVVMLCFTGCSETTPDADSTPSTSAQTTTPPTDEPFQLFFGEQFSPFSSL